MEEKKKEITEEVIDTFLNGHDPQQRIVNLEYSYKDNFIKVYYRNENDDKCVSEEPFFPFLWATYDACNRLCGGNRVEVKKLLDKYDISVKRLRTKNDDGTECDEMKNGYKFIFKAMVPMSYSHFLDFFKKAGNPVYSDKKGEEKPKSQDRQYISVTPQEQYLISTGKRFFKGYEDYDQLLRMTFDLETTGLDTHKDRIIQFGIRFNRPVKTPRSNEYHTFEKILTVTGNTEEERNKSELECIENAFKIIYMYRPDVITAHNGENFDWNMIINACERLGTSIEDVSSKYFDGKSIKKNERESILKLGGEIETFNQTIVPGIIVTDSLHAVRRAQATDSNFLQANLKYATKYLNLKKENRVYTPGSEISTIWEDLEEHYAFNDSNGDWYKYDLSAPNGGDFKAGKDGDKPFIMYTRNYVADGYKLVSGRYIIERYLLDDLWECDKVEKTLNGTDFMMCKIIPVTFQKCCTMGTASQWKAIMMAWSYENGLAIPLAENTGSFTGGLSRLLNVGYVDNVVKLDYNSLYPSIILTWGISDKTDLMDAMLLMLEYVLTTREKYKKIKKQADKECDEFKEMINSGVVLTPEQAKQYDNAVQRFMINDNAQMLWKKLGNSFFGSYGSNNGGVFPWKSQSCAERTTCTGRQSLRLMISHFHDLGYKPIVGDTDGFNFKLPDESMFRYTKEQPYVGLGLSREVKAGKEYVGFEADVAEFNDLYMGTEYFKDSKCLKMGLGIDEVVSATINFSRKNYADHFPQNPFPKDVKLVGNTIKSKKMPIYIDKFLTKAVRLLLEKKGQEFLNEYYNYIDKIYNYQIPVKDIASKGKIKKSIQEYIADCSTITKAGRPKSRQAWMELAIKNNLEVNLGETIYYINTGKKKSESDVKKVKHYYVINENGEKQDCRVKIEKEYKAKEKEYANGGAELTMKKFLEKYHPEVITEEEVILNCMMLTNDIINSDKDVYCEEGQEYNVSKYLEQFNNRIKPLLVCFSPDIRQRILITNPSDRPYFTEEECKLDSGHPNKPGDQDTYEALMTMDDREIRFWQNHNEWNIPFVEECHMNWDNIVSDYTERLEYARKVGADKVKEEFDKILANISTEEINNFVENGDIPSKILSITDVDPVTGNFVHKEYKDIVIGTFTDVYDAMNNKLFEAENVVYE